MTTREATASPANIARDLAATITSMGSLTPDRIAALLAHECIDGLTANIKYHRGDSDRDVPLARVASLIESRDVEEDRTVRGVWLTPASYDDLRSAYEAGVLD